MSARAHQEAEEDIALDVFRRASGLLPGAVTRVRPDPPDFLVTDRGRGVSVEMTRYHQDSQSPGGSAKAAKESLEANVTARAQELFEAGHPGVYVSVSPFFTHEQLHRRNLYMYAEKLARAVAILIPPVSTEPLVTQSAGWAELEKLGLDEVLTFLSVSRARASTRSQWGFGGAGYPSTDVGHLLSVIRDKEADLARYKETYVERWLIVYAVPQPSAFFDFEVLAPQMFQSRFDRVIFLDALMGHFVVIA